MGPRGFISGFGLNQDGETLYLLEPASAGDRVSGLGRVRAATCRPVGGAAGDRAVGAVHADLWAANIATATPGYPAGLKVNEWLANPAAPFFDDFIELYNPDSLPVAMGGLYLTDQSLGSPIADRIAPLSFIAGYGYRVFVADGNVQAGADHVDFRLAAEVGEIALLDQAGTVLDNIVYGPASRGVGRTNAKRSQPLKFFESPTPGSGNPAVQEPLPPLLVPLSLR